MESQKNEEIQERQVRRGRPCKPKPVEPENAPVEEQIKVKRGRPKNSVQKTLAKPSLYSDDPKAYFKAYYQNRPRVESVCEFCGKTFDSKILLGRH